MPNDALVSVPLIVAAVLVASAVGKLADPRRGALAFDALEVPRSLSRPWMRTAHPWAELVLALGLVVTSGSAAVLTAVVTTALSMVYLLLVVRAVRRPEPVDCACFGSAGSERVTGWTVVRNAWLLALSVAAVGAALDGRSPLQRVVELGGVAWWLAALVAAATTTALIAHPSAPEPAVPVTDPSSDLVGDIDLEDYVRTATPHAPVTTADGRVVSLRELSSSRPQLILAVSGWCSSCAPTIEAAPRWRERLPELDVHPMYTSEDNPAMSSASDPQTLHDPKRFALEALGLPGTPAAVLLGADGMLAGGPVTGHDAISAFVDEVEAELVGLRQHATSGSS